MAHEEKSRHTEKLKYVVGDLVPSNERRPDLKKEAGRRVWATETRKTPVGKKSGSGRRIHSPRNNLPG